MLSGVPEVADALREVFGANTRLAGGQGVSGGSISHTSIVELGDGRKVFLKKSRSTPAGLFRAEAEGLAALHAASGPRVPEPYALYEGPQSGYLLMEYVESGRQTPRFWQQLGAQMAELHLHTRGRAYGFHSDNFIGSTPQPNAWSNSWLEFFGERRISFQIERAARAGLADKKMQKDVEQIMARLPQLLPEPEHPALLHGDFWSGNHLCDAHGEPVIIDPAVYYGHREADLAMAECFGGFAPGFFAAYNEAYPLQAGYKERVDLYNLYHMLNHLNLFGSGYAGSVRAILRRYS